MLLFQRSVLQRRIVTQNKIIRWIQEKEMILDVGPKTAVQVDTMIQQAKTIIWNGAIGRI